MILPSNGKVVIIDDKPEDVKELIGVLSKEKVSFVHYKEIDLSDLPEKPIENVRLIFLDLELLSDTYLPAKNITSPIKTRLMRIIQPRTPYALVIWSKKENDYKQALLQDFEGEFAEYKPIFHTSLPKSDIIGKPDAISRIKKELENEIKNFRSFNAFLVWESIVNESSGKLTNDILKMLYPADKDWDSKSSYLLYKLALAYSGKAAAGFSEIRQLRNALYTLSLTFTDNIESGIEKLVDEKYSGLVSTKEISILNFTTVLNKLLLISDSSDDPTQPGNLFLLNEELQKKKLELDKDLEISMKKVESREKDEEKKGKALDGMKKKYSGLKQSLEDEGHELKSNLNEIAYSSIKDKAQASEILSLMKGVQLIVTPFCDYAQVKAKYSRLLMGVLIPAKFRESMTDRSDFVYLSDADFRYEEENYFLVFDFRYLTAVKLTMMNERRANVRLKQQYLSDIQVKLGAHVNRSGVVYIA